MKLLKCYVENFGKLHNFSYDFRDGLNVIKEDNGFGKTTFATFIKSMFYGLDTAVNVKTEKSDRKKYFPWQGGIYGGNIEFEVNNKKYRIEKFFGKKAAEDTFKLYNLDTNLESTDFTENIGEEIFKINKSAYERSTYIPQGQIQIDMEDSLSAKLGNVLENENDINTSENAIKKLNDARKFYKKDKGKGGLIDEKKDKLFELQRKLEDSKSDVDALEARKKQLDVKIKEIKQVEAEREKMQNLLAKKMEQDRNSAKKETYNKFLQMYKQSEEQYYNLNDFFANGIPGEKLFEKLSKQNSELEKTKMRITNYSLSIEDKNTLDSLKTEFDNKNITLDEINLNIVNCSKVQEIENEIQKNELSLESLQNEQKSNEKIIKRNEKNTKLFRALSFILIVIGIILIVLTSTKILAGVLATLGIVLCLFSLIKSRSIKEKEKNVTIKNNIEQVKAEIKNLKDNKSDMLNKIENMLNSFNIYKNNISDKIIELSNIKERYNRYNQLLASEAEKNEKTRELELKKEHIQRDLQNELMNYFPKIDKTFSELLQELKLKKNQLETALKQFQIAKSEKEKYENQNNIKKLQDNDDKVDISEQELKNKIEAINSKIDSLVDEKNQIKNNIEFLENKIDENEYLESDIQNLEEQIVKYNDKYKIIKTTEELLKTAKQSFSSSYLKDMVNGYEKYLKVINNEEVNTNVDIKLDVKVDVNGSQKEVKYFSAGYKDLIYICMRLSLINALYKEEKPFVVLDDPLVNLDEEKTEKALNLINEFSKQYQVIYFVCNSSRI